jgi:hypothetical protein
MRLFLSQHPNRACQALPERQRRRELRLERARDAARIAISDRAGWLHEFLFNLRMEFEQTL